MNKVDKYASQHRKKIDEMFQDYLGWDKAPAPGEYMKAKENYKQIHSERKSKEREKDNLQKLIQEDANVRDFLGIEGDVTETDRRNANAMFRLQAEGKDTKEMLDDRNGFEKWANLPEDQNWFMDTIDILTRPASGVSNVLESLSARNTKAKEVGLDTIEEQKKYFADNPVNGFEQFMEGLTGKDRKSFSDALASGGVENKYARGIGGFAGDVILDPLNLIPGVAFTKAAQGMKKGAGMVTPEPVKDTLGNIFNFKHKMDTTIDGAKSLDLEKVYRNTTDQSRYMQQNALDAIVQAAKVSNDGVAQGKVMEKPLMEPRGNFENVLNPQVPNYKDVIDTNPTSPLSRLADTSFNTTRTMSNGRTPTTQQVAEWSGKGLLQNNKTNLGVYGTWGQDSLNYDVTTLAERVVTNLNQPEQVMEYVKDAPDDVKKAAEMLIKQNKVVTDLAAEKGLGDLDQIKGYMAHVPTKDAQKWMKKNPSTGKRQVGGDKRVVSERYYKMPVDQANRLIRKEKGIKFDWFNPNALEATAEGQRRTINYIMAESAKREILSNPDFARPIRSGEPIPRGSDLTVIQPDDYVFFKTEGPDGDMIMKGAYKDGQKYVTTKAAKRVLDQFQDQMSDDGIRKFMTGFDKATNTWKKFALYSPAYHARNLLGNHFNMYVAGMNPATDFPRYTKASVVDFAKYKNDKSAGMVDEFRQQGLAEGSVFENEFLFDPTKATQRAIKRGTNNPIQNLPGHVTFEGSRELGTAMDTRNRYALYKWAREKQGLSPEKAAEKVRETLFDYSEITQAEKKIFKRAMPFYTWMRKNVPFQLYNAMTKPTRYTAVEKARDAGFEMTGMNEEELPDWLQESMAIPLTGDGEGNGTLLGANLPLSDLSQLSNPGRMAVNSANPIIKTPVEAAINHNMFTGDQIQEFDGQKQNVLGMFEANPKIAHIINSALGSLGNSTRRVGDVSNTDAILEELKSLGGLVKNHDSEKAKSYQKYELNQELEELMKLFEQENGRRPLDKRTLERLGIESGW